MPRITVVFPFRQIQRQLLFVFLDYVVPRFRPKSLFPCLVLAMRTIPFCLGVDQTFGAATAGCDGSIPRSYSRRQTSQAYRAKNL